jgi:hypothetical protein
MAELEIIPHPDEQRTYAELREEFRAANLQRIRSEFCGQHPLGWNMIGDPSTARDRYTAEQWAMEMLDRLDDPCRQDFGLTSNHANRLGARLEKQAQAALDHDSVTWPEGTDGTADADAPACCDVGAMTDEELCDYIDTAIQGSKRNG